MTGAAHPAKVLFVTHSAAAAGAELLMLRMLGVAEPGVARVLFLEDGDLVGRARSVGIDAAVEPLTGLSGYHRESGHLSALRRLPALAGALRRVGRHVSRGDLVVATSQKALVVLAALRLVRRDFRLVWWLHDILDATHFSRFSIRAATALSRAACTLVVANGQEARDAFVAAGGPASRVVVVEPGVDLREFSASRPGPTGPERDRLVILSSSRISPWKGQMTLLEALARVPGVEGWFAGAPLFGEADHLRRLEARRDDLGLTDRTVFLGHRDDVPLLLRQADIFVHVPDAVEPFGQVVVEAMASGVPVIVSDRGAPARIVADGGGLTVAPGDPEALARAIARLADDVATRRELGRAGIAASRAYDIGGMWTRFRSHLQMVRP